MCYQHVVTRMMSSLWSCIHFESYFLPRGDYNELFVNLYSFYFNFSLEGIIVCCHLFIMSFMLIREDKSLLSWIQCVFPFVSWGVTCGMMCSQRSMRQEGRQWQQLANWLKTMVALRVSIHKQFYFKITKKCKHKFLYRMLFNWKYIR